MARIGIQSATLFALPHLARFFPQSTLVRLPWLFPSLRGVTQLAGWGHKRCGRVTRALAKRHGLHYLALEDGFVRSYDLAVRGASPWSIVADDTGIYYDATRPSQLERLIAQGVVPPEADALMARMRDHRISKYNAAHFDAPALPGSYLLLIDQCAGDASVPLGMASAASFDAMLAAAKAKGQPLVIKTHPDVASGKRRGFLAAMNLPDDAVRISEEVNPYQLFEGATEVHTVTSLLGMEALIAGKKVVCYGAPFYAGWGLTEDRALPASVAARREARPSLLQLFAAAYLHYPRYIDPYSGAPSDLGASIDRILWLRDHYRDWPRRLHGWGFPTWKRPHVVPFLAPPGGAITFHDEIKTAVTAAQRDGVPLAIWAAKEPQNFSSATPLLRVEDGFLRSRGLGSDLIAADSLAVDARGIYFDGGNPSHLEQQLEGGGFDAALLTRAALLREAVIAAALSKYNLGGEALPDFPSDRPLHLVVGQVEDDASIQRGGRAIRTNAELLAQVRAAHPEAWILYKPHPDVLAGNRRAGAADRAATDADQWVGHVALPALLARVDALHTITSLAGFEMLLRGGRVITYGQPFYAGWGLTDDKAGPFPRRTRRATLDELVAAALILYPRYYDWQARLPSSPEQTIARMAQPAIALRTKASWRRQAGRLKRWSGL